MVGTQATPGDASSSCMNVAATHETGEDPVMVERRPKKGSTVRKRRPRAPLRVRLDQLAHNSFLPGEWANFLYGATRVAFHLHNHPTPVELLLDRHPGPTRRRAVAAWQAPTEQLIASFQPKERTERTAECVSLAALRAQDNLTICGRAEEFSGSDWVVGPDIFQPRFRVEVSGIDAATASNSGEARLRGKVSQILDARDRGLRPMAGIAAVFVIKTRVLLTEHVPLG